MINYSALVRNWPASGIREMLDLYRDHPGAVNLCNGDPDLPTPEHIVDEGIRALKDGCTKYSGEAGIPELREAVAEKYHTRFGAEFSGANVMVTAGSVEAVFIALAGLIEPGDEVLIPDPGYTSYEGQVRVLGGEAVRVRSSADDNFQISKDTLRSAITERTRVLILNTPGNPTGRLMSCGDAGNIADVLEGTDIVIISDEVYEKIVFDGAEHFSPMEHPRLKDRVIIANSLSKTYAMTGWRLGYLFGPEKIISGITRLQQALVSCLPVFIQKAGVAALRGPQDCVEKMRMEYQKRRDLIVSSLEQPGGPPCLKAGGSLGMLVDITGSRMTSREFSMRLLSHGEVLTVPGSAFGQGGEGFIRLAFASSAETVALGAERLFRFYREMTSLEGPL